MTRGVAAAVACVGLVGAASAQSFLLSDFSTGGFQYSFDDFTQTHDPVADTVRLTDTINGWGGAGISFASPIDLSGMVDNYVQADFRIEPNHGAGEFVIELYDTADRSIKFSSPTGGHTGAGFETWTSPLTLGNPVDGVGDFQNFDYSNVRTWQVLGDFDSPQPFDITFDRVSIEQLSEPPPFYQGQESDASWRAEADTRIDQHRKADLNLNITLADGRAAPGATVHVAQQEHAFQFGSAVASRLLTGPQTNTTYRNKVAEHFNTSVMENSLKWPAWEGDYGPSFNPTNTVAALNWLQNNGVDSRGHVLVWPSFGNSPNSVQGLQNNPAALRQAVLDHIADITAATDGLLYEWDVVNEPRTNNDFLNILGDDVMVDWFNAAAAATDATLFLNEFGLVTGGNSTANNRLIHHNYIQGLLADGAPLGGLGIQSHFRANDLTGIEQVWDIFDEFAAYGLPIAISEFDFETTDRDLQADYAADFLKASFAHEGVSEFLMWGFWAGAHWRPEAAIYDQNWNLRPHGQAMLDLIYNEWWTDEMLNADALGEASLRGFKGEYEVTVTLGIMSHVVTVTLDEDGQIVGIALPGGMLGDMDFNGVLDEGDALAYVLAMVNAAQYEAIYGLDPALTGDVNQDGLFNLADIEPLAGLLSPGGAALLQSFVAVPEPTTAGVLSLGLLGLATRRRRGD